MKQKEQLKWEKHKLAVVEKDSQRIWQDKFRSVKDKMDTTVNFS